MCSGIALEGNRKTSRQKCKDPGWRLFQADEWSCYYRNKWRRGLLKTELLAWNSPSHKHSSNTEWPAILYSIENFSAVFPARPSAEKRFPFEFRAVVVPFAVRRGPLSKSAEPVPAPLMICPDQEHLRL